MIITVLSSRDAFAGTFTHWQYSLWFTISLSITCVRWVNSELFLVPSSHTYIHTIYTPHIYSIALLALLICPPPRTDFRTKNPPWREKIEEKWIGMCAAGSITCPLHHIWTLHHIETLQSRWLVENRKEKGGRIPWGPSGLKDQCLTELVVSRR